MWWLLLGCSLPEPDAKPLDTADYQRRDDPFAEVGDAVGDDGSTVDTAGTSWRTVQLSGDLLVQVSDATTEYATCGGAVEMSMTGDEIVGYSECVLASGPVTTGNKLTLTFGGFVSDYGVFGWVRGETDCADRDSFEADWIATRSDAEMRGNFVALSSDQGNEYDGQFSLTPDQ